MKLDRFISSFHKFTASQWNRSENKPGRKVWYNYWDTCIRSEEDYLARLKYVFWNPVKHGLAQNPEDYRYSNYAEYVDFFSGINVEEVEDVPEV